MLFQICRASFFFVVFCSIHVNTVRAVEGSCAVHISPLIQANRSYFSTPVDLKKRGAILNLEDLIDIALKNNPAIEAVRQRRMQSQGRFTQARSGYLPQLEINAQYYYTERENSASLNGYQSRTLNTEQTSLDINEAEEDDVAQGSANLSQLIYDFGRTTGAIEVGRFNFSAAGSQLQRQIQDTVFLVKKAYFRVLEEKRLIDVAAEAVKSFQQHLDRAKVNLKAGVRTKIDVINAKTELSKTKITLLQAQYGLKTARVELVEVLGKEPFHGQYDLYGDEVHINNILTAMPPVSSTLDQLLTYAMEQRSDILRLKKLIKAAEANYEQIKGDYYPSITAEADYNDYDTDLSLFKDSWQIGVKCTWKLFSGFRTKGAIAEAKGILLENRAQLQTLQLTIVREVTNSYLRAYEFRERVKMALQTLELAKENFHLSEKRYQSGAYDAIEFNDAQLSLTRTRNELVVTYYGYLIALAGIEHATSSYLK